MAVPQFDMRKQVQRGDSGQQAGPGTRLYLRGLWGLFLTIALLPRLDLICVSPLPLPFVLRFLFLPSAGPAFCANGVCCKLTSLARRLGRGG